jgi:hypothetical protein
LRLHLDKYVTAFVYATVTTVLLLVCIRVALMLLQVTEAGVGVWIVFVAFWAGCANGVVAGWEVRDKYHE